jgi:hypothetical protein
MAVIIKATGASVPTICSEVVNATFAVIGASRPSQYGSYVKLPTPAKAKGIAA